MAYHMPDKCNSNSINLTEIIVMVLKSFSNLRFNKDMKFIANHQTMPFRRIDVYPGTGL